MRNASQRPILFRRAVPGRKELIIQLYAGGLSISQVAARIGVSNGCVGNTLKPRGLLRSRSEGRALQSKRARRIEMIAAAAQKQFGHVYAPAREQKEWEMPPVNEMFEDTFDAWGEWS